VNKAELTSSEKLARHLIEVENHTDYEMIEIEQVNPKFNRIESIQVLTYTVKWDKSDRDNPVVEELTAKKITATSLMFVNNPYPNLRRAVGTGRVAYLVNDDKKNFENSLSGEPIGRNLEFLASHYAGNLFKIIDPRWEEVVKKRHEAILEALKIPKPPHKFDRRYSLKGMVEDRVKVEIEQPENVSAMVEAFNRRLDEKDALIKDLLAEKGVQEEQPVTKKPRIKKPVKKAEKEEPIKSAFAGQEV